MACTCKLLTQKEAKLSYKAFLPVHLQSDVLACILQQCCWALRHSDQVMAALLSLSVHAVLLVRYQGDDIVFLKVLFLPMTLQQQNS